MSPKDERRRRAHERAAHADRTGRAVIDAVLFDDPLEQLLYEVRHMYLHVVPPREREQYPLDIAGVLPSFLEDVDKQAHALSRQQIISVIVDVACGRARDINSRQVRPLRTSEVGAAPPVLRSSDGAQAWRANVSNVTASARRIMWWQRPGSGVELARLAVHDDLRMPES